MIGGLWSSFNAGFEGTSPEKSNTNTEKRIKWRIKFRDPHWQLQGKLELRRYNWKLWIDRNHIDKKLLSIIVEILFSLSNSVPGSCSAFMFQFCPNHRGTQSRASNSLSYVIGSKLLSFFLTTTMKK